MTITEECFQRGIYTRRDIYTKISVILPGTKAALRDSKVESRRRGAEIYLAARRDFVFVGARGEEKGGQKKRGRGRAIFSMRKDNAGNARERDRIKETPSHRCVLHAKLTRVIIVDEALARSASSASASAIRVHPKDTHVRTDEA